MPAHDTPEVLLTLLAVSFVFYMLVSRWNILRIPSIVIYIFFGCALENTALPHGYTPESAIVAGLGKFGFLFLMFLSGLEVDFRLVLSHREQSASTVPGPDASRGPSAARRSPLWIGAALFFLTLLLAACISLCISHFVPQVHAWILTLILSTTSLGVILPVMKETKIAATREGQTLLTAALLADMLTLIAISIGAALYVGSAATMIITLLILTIPAVVGFVILSRARRHPRFNRFLPHQPIDQVRGALALVALCSLISSLSGAEPILGSFMAGLLVSALNFPGKEKLKENAEAIGYGFIIPIFFITVGLHFHVNTFFSSGGAWKWVPLLFAASFVVKLIPSLWLLRDWSTRRSLAAGTLLSSRLSLVIAAAAVGLRIGAVPAPLADALLVMAVATCFVSPILFAWLW